MNAELRVRSCIPGRVRWHMPWLLHRPDRCEAVAEELAAMPFVRHVEANSGTASLLVLHDASVSPDTLAASLLSALQGGTLEPGPSSWVSGKGQPPDEEALTLEKRVPSPAVSGDPLLDILRPHRKAVVKSLVLTLVDRLFEASPPALISLIVDAAAKAEDSVLAPAAAGARLQGLLSAGAVVWTADSAVGYFRSVAANQLGTELRQDLRQQLYEHFQTLDLAQIEHELPEYWESVFQKDVNTVARYLEQGLDPLVSIAANALIVFVQLLMTSAALALFQLAVIPGLYFASSRLLPAIHRRRALSGAAESTLQSRLRSNLQGFSTIASFAREPEEAARVAELGARVTQVRENEYKLTAAYVPLLQMIVGVGFLGTLGFGSLLVRQRQMRAAQLSMIGYSSLRFLTALGHLGVGIDEYQRARLATQKIEDFRARASQIPNGRHVLEAQTVKGHIEVRGISFAYAHEKPVFQHLSMEFPAGKTVGIVGLSGAGKSTLLKLLLRYYDVSAGEILLDGRDIRDMELHSMRRLVGYVPQQPFLFPGTVRENIAYSRPEATLAEVMAAAKAARAHAFIEALPQGYETLVRNSGLGGQGQALSGGQAQRIAIARAALTGAPALLLDEATSAVDNETEAALHESLYEAMRGKTVVLVAHRLSTVRHADLIYVLDQGRVAEAGNHEELVAKNGIYAGFWKVQTGAASETKATDVRTDAVAKIAEAKDTSAPLDGGPQTQPDVPLPAASELDTKLPGPAPSAVERKRAERRKIVASTAGSVGKQKAATTRKKTAAEKVAKPVVNAVAKSTARSEKKVDAGARQQKGVAEAAASKRTPVKTLDKPSRKK